MEEQYTKQTLENALSRLGLPYIFDKKLGCIIVCEMDSTLGGKKFASTEALARFAEEWKQNMTERMDKMDMLSKVLIECYDGDISYPEVFEALISDIKESVAIRRVERRFGSASITFRDRNKTEK